MITQNFTLCDTITKEHKRFFPKEASLSQISFTSVYIWQKPYEYKAFETPSALFVYYKYGERFFAMPPFGEYTEEDIALFREYIGKPIAFVPLSDTEKERLSAISGSYVYKPIRSMFDYIYKTEELISLKGSRYHGKRGHISHFFSSYTTEYIKITPENLSVLSDAADALFALSPDLEDEHIAIKTAIENFEMLDLKAAVLKADGAFAAYSIASVLGDTALIHFEKADRALNGAYPAICNSFLREELSDTVYADREEDMGIEGLRKSKLSYHPLLLKEAYLAYHVDDEKIYSEL